MSDVFSRNEEERLEAVRRYAILDAPPDAALDRVTRLAARLFNVPVAIISIVDRERVWLASGYGVEAQEIPRQLGLCASAIMHDRPWLVQDARSDPRTRRHPLVEGEFGLRFYAGVHLRSKDGYNIGTLGIIDRKPRDLTEGDLGGLTELAAIVMAEMELRRSRLVAAGEREVAFKELHHRIKNNLQVVAGLLTSERRMVPEGYRIHFEESLRRVEAMGRLHQKFYEGDDVHSVDLTSYLRELAEAVFDSFGLRDRVSLRLEGHPVRLGVGMGTPLGLLVTELVSNSCKHGFPGTRRGRITIRVAEVHGQLHLQVRDDGVGLPGEAPSASAGMGSRLIARFVQQLGGVSSTRVDGGTVFELTCPLTCDATRSIDGARRDRLVGHHAGTNGHTIGA